MKHKAYIISGLLLVLLLAAVAILFNAPMAFLVLIVFLWSLGYSSFFKLSLFLSAVSGIVTYYVANIVIYTVSMFTGIDLSQALLILFHALLATPFVILLILNRNKLSRPRLHGADIFAATAFLVVFVTLMAPFSSGGSLQKLAILSTAEDNSVHFSIFNAITHNQRIVYQDDPSEIGLIDVGANSYPQGLHLNMASDTVIAFGDTPDIHNLIRSFTLHAIAYYALFSALLIYIISYAIVRKRPTIRKHLLALSFSTLVLYLSCLGTFLQLFIFGYQSQIAAYAIMLSLLAVIMYVPNKESLRAKYLVFGFIPFAIIASTFTWFFISPIVVGFSLIWLYKERLFLKKRIALVIVAAIAASIFVLTPILFYLFSYVPLNQVLIGGGIYPEQPTALLLACLITVIFFITLRIVKKKDAPLPKESFYLLAFILVGFTFLLALYVYSNLKTGGVNYYFYKSQYNLTVLILASIGLSIETLMERIKIDMRNLDKILILSSFAAFSIVLCVFMKPIAGTTVFLEGRYQGSLNTEIIEFMFKHPEATDIIIKPACYSVPNYMTEKWLAALMLSGSEKRTDLLLDHLLVKSFPVLPGKYVDYMKENPHAMLLDNTYCAKQLKTE